LQIDYKIFVVALSNSLVKGIGIATSIFSIYVLSHLLKIDEFGVWAWLFSVCTLITSQDFGVISAMRIEISKTADDKLEQKNLLFFSTFQAVLIVVASSFLVSLGIIFIHLDIDFIKAPVGLFFLVVLIALFSLFGTIAANFLLACFKEDVVAKLDLLRNVTQFLAVLLIYLLTPSYQFAITIFFIPYALYALLGIYLVMIFKGWNLVGFIKLLVNNFSQQLITLGFLIRKGLSLWAIQLASIIFSGGELLYVGFYTDDATIGVTSILQKYVNVAIGFITATIFPFLGHYASRIHRRSDQDLVWLKRVSSLKVNICIAIGLLYTFVLVIYGSEITKLWSGQIIDDPILFFLIGAVFTVTGLNVLSQLFYQSSEVYIPVVIALLICGIIKLGGIALLITNFNMRGIWISFFVGNLIFLLFNIYYVRRKLLYQIN